MKISVVIPTRNRVWLLHSVVEMFRAQTCKDSELIILDDGEDKPHKKQWFDDDRIRYYHEPRLSLGYKHNRLCELAQGEYIVPFSDDDWQAPWRIEYQVSILEQLGADLCIADYNSWLDAKYERAWVPYGQNPASLAFRRSVWEASPYEDVHSAEDHNFLYNALAHEFKMVKCLDHRFMVQRIWDGNHFSGMQMSAQWAVPFEEVKALIGADYDRYFGGEDGLPK